MRKFLIIFIMVAVFPVNSFAANKYEKAFILDTAENMVYYKWEGVPLDQVTDHYMNFLFPEKGKKELVNMVGCLVERIAEKVYKETPNFESKSDFLIFRSHYIKHFTLD
jgi:hypothetical protein